jgi:hypothetical protein
MACPVTVIHGHKVGNLPTPPPPLECVVIRTADANKVLAKRIGCDAGGNVEFTDFDQVAEFTFAVGGAPDLRAFGRGLYRLARDPHAAILRGALLPHVVPGQRYFRRARAGDGTDSLADCDRAWVGIDMDDVPLPPGIDWRDAAAVAMHLQTRLPLELRGCDCLLAWSAKQGFRAPGTVRCKLFFGLTAPVSDEGLRRWALTWNAQQGAKIIDHALFSPTQLHYVADPIFAPGIADPLATIGRWHWCPGVFAERATIVLPPVVVSPLPPGASQARTGGGFADRLSRIGDPVEGFRAPIIAALGAAARAQIPREAAIAAVRKVVLAANPGHRTSAEIARYASDQYLGSAFTQFSRQDATRRQAEAGKEFKPEPARPARAAWQARHVRALADYVAMKQEIERRRAMRKKGGSTDE